MTISDAREEVRAVDLDRLRSRFGQGMQQRLVMRVRHIEEGNGVRRLGEHARHQATHAIAVLNVPDQRQTWMLHALTEIGANAIQFETSKSASNAINVFARV